jgi:hypothetical protein
MICGADNDSVRLGISTVAGIADGVDDIRAVRVVQDRRAAIVAAVGIGFCEAKPAVLVDRRDHAGKAAGHRIAGIDHRRRVGIRDIERIDRRKVSHEGHDPAIGRQIERNLRFGRKAGDHLVLVRRNPAIRAIGHLERIDQFTGRPELVQHDLCGNAETGVCGVIIPDIRIGTVRRRAHAIGSDAVRGQRRPHGDIGRIVVVYRAADQQISRSKTSVIVVGKGAGGAHDSRQEKCDGQTRPKSRRPGEPARSRNIH